MWVCELRIFWECFYIIYTNRRMCRNTLLYFNYSYFNYHMIEFCMYKRETETVIQILDSWLLSQLLRYCLFSFPHISFATRIKVQHIVKYISGMVLLLGYIPPFTKDWHRFETKFFNWEWNYLNHFTTIRDIVIFEKIIICVYSSNRYVTHKIGKEYP